MVVFINKITHKNNPEKEEKVTEKTKIKIEKLKKNCSHGDIERHLGNEK